MKILEYLYKIAAITIVGLGIVLPLFIPIGVVAGFFIN
jgi:hypothetical protein